MTKESRRTALQALRYCSSPGALCSSCPLGDRSCEHSGIESALYTFRALIIMERLPAEIAGPVFENMGRCMETVDMDPDDALKICRDCPVFDTCRGMQPDQLIHTVYDLFRSLGYYGKVESP